MGTDFKNSLHAFGQSEKSSLHNNFSHSVGSQSCFLFVLLLYPPVYQRWGGASKWPACNFCLALFSKELVLILIVMQCIFSGKLVSVYFNNTSVSHMKTNFLPGNLSPKEKFALLPFFPEEHCFSSCIEH